MSTDLKILLKTARTIAEIQSAIGLANESIAKARQDDDLRSLRFFFELKMRLERRGGELLGKWDSSGLGENTVKRWGKLAAMNPDVFSTHLNSAVLKQTIAHPGGCRIAMKLSAWRPDEFGNPTRFLTAVDR